MFKGDKFPILLTLPSAFPKVKVAVGSADGKDLYQQFAYPTEVGYDEMTTTDNITYKAVLGADATISARTGLAVIDVKVFDAEDNSSTGRSNPFELNTSYLDNGN